ncbi:MAG TPA: oligosaccharide flippase family protein [Terriglobales bacterium]|nr:oligosaccharide flippase family protein [Terriglobales bacterium]
MGEALVKEALKRSIPGWRYGGYVFSVAGARTAGILISSLTFPYLVRRLGVEAYGQWSYVVALCAFLNVVADPGMNVFLMQQVAARKQAAFESIPDVLFLRFLSSLLAAIALLAILSHEARANVRQVLLLYGIGILFTNLTAADHLLGALELFHARSLLTVMQQLVYALMVFLTVRSASDLFWLPISLLSSAAASSLGAWIVLWRSGVRFRARLRPRCWGQILVPSLHYSTSTLMSNIYHRTGHLLVRWFLGDFALGIYAAAVRFVELLRGFLIIILQVLMPRIAAAAESAAELRRLARYATSVIAIFSVPLTVGLIGTAHLLVPWVMGTKYLADVPLLQWMAPYLITAPAASLFSGTILFAMGRHRAYLASTAGGALAGAFLYLTLIPMFGLRGAALAFVMAELVVAAIALAKIPELHGSWKNAVLWISPASALLMVFAIRVANTYTSQATVVVFVGACVYMASCGWFVRRLFFEH